MHGKMYKCLNTASYHVQESNQQLALVNGLEFIEMDRNKRVTDLFRVLPKKTQKNNKHKHTQMKL